MPEEPAITDTKEIFNKSRLLFVRLLLAFSLVATFLSPIIISIFSLGDPKILFNIAFFTVLLILFAFSFTQYVFFTYSTTVFLIFTVLIYMNFSPTLGYLNNDNSMLVIFPVVAFFLLGKKLGILWTLVYFVVSSALIVLNIAPVPTKDTFIFHMTTSIIGTTLAVYFYQFAVDTAEKLVKKRENQLKQTIDTIMEQKQELANMNQLMVGRELTMVEMKKKIQELEAQQKNTVVQHL